MGSELQIGFLGAGKMASALAKGFVQAGIASASHLIASDPVKEARSEFEKLGGRSTVDASDVFSTADVVFIAVKPAQVGDLLRKEAGHIRPRHLLVSIAAGITLSKLESALPERIRVVRVMPNTPALIGASASAYALGTSATADDGSVVERLLGSVGLALEVKESLLDAVTGLSGSGPAYAYMIIEALSDGGVAAGLPREVATRLAAQTLLGSARMVLETGLHPGALKDMVTSPGGTTIEGVHELEKGGLRAALMTAVRAAADKSRKLGQS
jgi:pyrroline-5-carboxylate reductase